MAQKIIGTINLLDPMNPPQDFFSLVYEWLNTAGKLILVIVEIIVLIAFFTRFVYDKKNNDLTETINNKVAVLSEPSLQKEEVYFSNMNLLLSDIKKLSASQKISSVQIASILDGIPADIRLVDFQFYENKVNMSFIASSFDSISNYESDLDDNPHYKNVSVILDKDKTASSVGTIKFSVSFDLN